MQASRQCGIFTGMFRTQTLRNNSGTVLFLALLFLAGCAQKSNDTVLARFGGSKITASEFKEKMQNLPKEIKNVVVHRKKDFLEEMVNEQYLYQEAMKRNIQNEPELKELLEAARRKILIAKLIQEEIDKKISLDPAEATNFYESHKEEFMTPLLLRASHILVKTEAEANEIKNQLDAGADFEQLARAKSLDNTGIRGGDLGFFQKGQMIPEFEEAAFQMKKGEIGGVVKTPFGYHIIKLTDRAEPAQRDFRQVKNLVEKQLLNDKRSKHFNELMKKLKGNDQIQIDEKALDAVSSDSV